MSNALTFALASSLHSRFNKYFDLQYCKGSQGCQFIKNIGTRTTVKVGDGYDDEWSCILNVFAVQTGTLN